jgi:hypothetical protein
MKLYFAGLADPALLRPGVNVLLSYLDKTTIAKLNYKIFLDSGAFSVFTQGKQINIDEYIEYIKTNNHLFETYATLDVIGDWEKTKINTEYMESKGLNPLPTFHHGSPLSELKRLINSYDYIALGGLVPLARQQNQLRDWLDYCFSHIGTKTKVHGFGLTSKLLTRYPFYSVDSTSWLSYCAYFKTVKHNAGAINVFGKETWAGPKNKNYGSFINTKLQNDQLIVGEFLKLQEYITKLWEKRGIVWED